MEGNRLSECKKKRSELMMAVVIESNGNRESNRDLSGVHFAGRR